MMSNLIATNSTGSKQRIGLFTRLRALRGEGGGPMIELALVIPIFTILLVGASEFAILAYDGIEVSNAARAGVAYGSQSAALASDIAGMQAAAINDSTNVAGLSAAANEFFSCSNAPATQYSTPPGCAGNGNRVLTYVQVTTSAAVSPTIRLPGLPASYTLNGLAIMRVQ
jgi:Flp pilus assembly protein TadG